ncbi:MAG: RNA 3'-terminal phosphate cyclase [Methanosarcinaceae archaeon]|nr:RNA 3'-terminal phosphate cyclase [Methanosarcinaceae archaeon]
MIEIDGSYGEGGGQIIRTAVALSAVTGKKIRVTNIRKNRPKPGLKPQHVKSIETAALLCDADVTGLSIGSTDVMFAPMELKGDNVKLDIDIGTAGSISLLLQCIMPAAACTPDGVELTITGGTDVAWSPTIDYLKHVTFSALSKMGYDCEIELLARGYYPKGGGRVRAHLKPARFKGFDLTTEIGKGKIYGISHCANLPEHVAKRQADSAASLIRDAGYDCEIETVCVTCRSTGSGISLWHGMVGGSALGKRGLPAEKVGENAAKEILTEICSGASVDVHLADQLIPYMGLGLGLGLELCGPEVGFGSFTVRELTQHTLTNIWVTEQFLDVKFKVQKIDGLEDDQKVKLVKVSVR